MNKALISNEHLLNAEMEIFKSNRSFCNFYPTLFKTFVLYSRNKQVPFKYLKRKLLSQIDSGAFVKIITRNVFFFF